MDKSTYPPPPAPPPPRVEYCSLFGSLMFKSREEFEAWKKEPFLSRLFGNTAYDRRLAADLKYIGD